VGQSVFRDTSVNFRAETDTWQWFKMVSRWRPVRCQVRVRVSDRDIGNMWDSKVRTEERFSARVRDGLMVHKRCLYLRNVKRSVIGWPGTFAAYCSVPLTRPDPLYGNSVL
jgi:hypothetical protein